ncbi:inorganic phosphate transporter [Heliomarina baculiformis]|uniref:inorganic phosphate transporter n=1 Tax=Heliomarina baculiformis TaxID=2872036 RepID=UPI001EE39F61|nr:inorganic phosphate transporter [Heliomarina baculiformis]
MTQSPLGNNWTTLDKDLKRIGQLELATAYVARPLVGTGIALVFLILAGVAAAIFFEQSANSLAVIIASVFGAYLAINIGANDVANNMGPAVGARVITLGGALIIAAICESAGALLAGGHVITTISQDIIHAPNVADPEHVIWAMLASLIGAALWINVSTWVGAPVSTTHSIIGAVLGAGVAALGLSAVNWSTVLSIAAGWLVAPILGGIVAACFLALIKSRVIYRDDKIAAARFWVPILVGLITGAFATYLASFGLSKVVSISLQNGLLIGIALGGVLWALSRPFIRHQSEEMENRNKSLKILFRLPLMIAAAMLSFAHGANDVANAVGPVAAIAHTVQNGPIGGAIEIPQWVILIGALGISFGLLLFGPRLISVVGDQITKLNPMRAFCVVLSSAMTVILASSFGLPVSSTHVAVGGIFGVGFFREWYMARRFRKTRGGLAQDQTIASVERRRRKLVRRSHFLTVIAAWVITVPASALLSSLVYSVINLFLG